MRCSKARALTGHVLPADGPAYAQAWLNDADQWIFDGLPPEILVVHGYPRSDSASRTAIVRVGSLTWSVLDRAEATDTEWHLGQGDPIRLRAR